MQRHPTELISAYADDELDAGQRAEIEMHLAACTECTRELALIRSIREAMLRTTYGKGDEDMWQRVQRRITRPIGWLLLSAGVAVWVVLALIEYFRQRELTVAWLSVTAIGIGIALIAVDIGYQQYVEWRDSPYKDIKQ